jgi:hypothetical protein
LDQQEVARLYLRGEPIEHVIRDIFAEREEGIEAEPRPRYLASDHDHVMQQRQCVAGKRVVDGRLGGAQE